MKLYSYKQQKWFKNNKLAMFANTSVTFYKALLNFVFYKALTHGEECLLLYSISF